MTIHGIFDPAIFDTFPPAAENEFSLAAVMDAIALTLVNAGVLAVERIFPYPPDSALPPCVVVGYPDDITFDMTFGRGSDRASFPVWFVVGQVSGLASRDALSRIITGAAGLKGILDGNLGGAVQTVRVQTCVPDVVAIGDVQYLAAKFVLDVIA